MTINLRGRMLDLSKPIVMGIINATLESFYEPSQVLYSYMNKKPRPLTREEYESQARGVFARAVYHITAGAKILDVGACSTRPGLAPVSEEEELRRLDLVLPTIREHFPDAIVSIDTFRSNVVRHCVEKYDIDIINDVSAGSVDAQMFATAAELKRPYVLMHGYGPDGAATVNPDGGDPADVAPRIARFFAERLEQLHDMGVADVILDPGIGFGKTHDESFAVMHTLPQLVAAFPDNAWLVGLSRKSFIYDTLNAEPHGVILTPEQAKANNMRAKDALNGTTVMHTLALLAGVNILRVHDTIPAMEAITLLRHCR